MKKASKIIATLLLFLVAIPFSLGYATTLLWNHILIPACGFSAITLLQGVGIFVLGQLLSGGFVLGCFFVAGSIHHIIGHHGGKMGRHWHNMTDEERREFFERRAKFGFRHSQAPGNGAE